MTTTMFDNINVGAIGVGDEEAGYVNGRWPTFAALVARFPGKPILSIAVNASVQADALDVEPGDATNAQAAVWFRGWVRRILARPVFYTSASNVEALMAALAAAGINRGQYYIWSAHYTYVAHLCGPQCRFGNWNADLTQWTNKVGGDESLVQDYVFTAATPPIPTPVPPPSVGPAQPIPGDTAMNIPFSLTTGNDGTAYLPLAIPAGCTKITGGSVDVLSAEVFTPPHHDGDITAGNPSGASVLPVVGGAPAGFQAIRVAGAMPNHSYTGNATAA